MKLLVIGNSPQAHLKYSSPYVSTYQAELLLLDNGDMLLMDRGSKNGTYVNKKKLTPDKEVKVTRNDRVTFADCDLDWRQVPDNTVDMAKVQEIKGVGSHYMNNIQVSGERVSRFHATFKRMKDNKWYICDHSKNGTTVNGTRIPKDMDYRIRRGDRIVCADVPVKNPISGIEFPWTMLGGVAAAVVMVVALFLFINSKPKEIDIHKKYKSAMALVVGVYHYEVTAPGLDLDDITKMSYILEPSGDLAVPSVINVNEYTATGFFVSPDGKLITNLHVVKPWLFDRHAYSSGKVSSKGEYYANQYKYRLSVLKDKFDEERYLGRYSSADRKIFAECSRMIDAAKSQLSVSGILDYIAIVPDGSYWDVDNRLNCTVLDVSENPEVDLAILKIKSNAGLPSGATYIGLQDFASAKKNIQPGQHMYTLGYPMGLGLQEIDDKEIFALGAGGNVSSDRGVTFGFDAASFHGASGSPIFDEKGKLIGVVSAGVEYVQGYNMAVNAKYIKALLEKEVRL